MRPPCYIHIGTHKTGTTSIQWLLAHNALALARAEITIPRTGREVVTSAGHHNLAWELIGDGRYIPWRGSLAELAFELRAGSALAACISSEDLSFLHGLPEALGVLVATIAAAGYEPRFVVYLRAQLPYARSLAREFARSGHELPEETIFAAALEDGRIGGAPYITLFDYDELLEPFAALVGDRNVIVRPYLPSFDDRSILRDFVDTIAPERRPVPIELLELPPRMNASPPAAPFAPELIDRFAERFAASNARVAERFGTRIPTA